MPAADAAALRAAAPVEDVAYHAARYPTWLARAVGVMACAALGGVFLAVYAVTGEAVWAWVVGTLTLIAIAWLVVPAHVPLWSPRRVVLTVREIRVEFRRHTVVMAYADIETIRWVVRRTRHRERLEILPRRSMQQPISICPSVFGAEFGDMLEQLRVRSGARWSGGT